VKHNLQERYVTGNGTDGSRREDMGAGQERVRKGSPVQNSCSVYDTNDIQPTKACVGTSGGTKLIGTRFTKKTTVRVEDMLTYS